MNSNNSAGMPRVCILFGKPRVRITTVLPSPFRTEAPTVLSETPQSLPSLKNRTEAMRIPQLISWLVQARSTGIQDELLEKSAKVTWNQLVLNTKDFSRVIREQGRSIL